MQEWAQSNGPQNSQRMLPPQEALKKHRFFLEDGKLLVRIEKLCEIAGMYSSDYTPISSMITQLSQMTGEDLRSHGGLSDIGLDTCENRTDVMRLVLWGN